MIDVDGIAQKVDPRFGDNAFIPAAPAFMYLYRRFGFTDYGCDSYKSVCCYRIETKETGLYVLAKIGGFCSLGWTAKRKLYDLLYDRHREDWKELMMKCSTAIEDCVRDLTRPIMVRDVSITIFGESTAEDDKRPICEHSPMAGYGVPTGAYAEPDLFIDFMHFVRKFGNGNMSDGMKSLMKKVTMRFEG